MRGSPLYWESAGSGDPLVLLHAGVADLRMWDDQWEAFAARNRVIRFDAQGFGRSPAAPEPATRADDLYELFQTLGIRRAHLVGVSAGGGAAIDFAVNYPGMVGALIPVASGLSGWEPSHPSRVEWIDDTERRQEALQKQGDMDGATELLLQAWLAGPQRDLQSMDRKLVERLRPMARFTLEREKERVRTPRLSPPAAGRLGEITAPTLVMVGDYDVPALLDIADTLVQGIPAARKQVFPETAHMINMERPAEFNQSALEFLSAHPL